MRLFRLLLRLYPTAYRDRYAMEMESFFRRELEASGGGAGFWARLVVDHVEASWAVRSRARRDRKGDGAMEFWDDLRAAARSLVRAPRFTIFAVATLALGVGAVTAVFTVVDHVLLRPLPYPGSERMALVGIEPRHDPGSLGPLSPVLLVGLTDRLGPAEAVVAATEREVILRSENDPERVTATATSEGFLDFFGAAPALGRLLDARDHMPGAEPVVVLSHEVWLTRFGGDPGIVGRAMQFDDRVHTVVGVIDERFVAPPEVVEDGSFWVPLETDMTVRSTFFLSGILRMRPEATLAELDEHGDAIVRDAYGDSGHPTFLLGMSVRDYREAVVGQGTSNLRRVMAAVVLLLLIASVNVAGLVLTRGAARRHELGVHFALGARRARLVRRLLSESLVLASVGGLLGAGLAWWAIELFRAYAPAELPRLAEVVPDLRGLAFAMVAAGATVVLSGLVPALRSTIGVSAATNPVRGATAAKGEGRLRGALVAAETGLAVVLTVGSALLAHDLIRVANEDPGFRPAGLVAMQLNLEPRYERAEWGAMWERLLEASAAVPQVGSTAVATQAPWDGTRMASTYRPEGWQEEEDAPFATTVSVAGDYLGVLGARLVEGRRLEPIDEEGELGILVNESFAARFWPGESGVGKVVGSGEPDEPSFRVVGVVGDVRTRPGRDVFPTVYQPLGTAPWREMEILVRADGDVAELASGLREAVRRIDPELPVTDIRTVATISSRSLATPRFFASLFGGFAITALLLAVVGVYGTTAYATRARLPEAGIRMVLGARSEQVIRGLVVRSAVAVGAGTLFGLGLALVGSSLLSDALQFVGPRDWPTYATVGLFVIATGVIAAWLPATAAGRADPLTILRSE